jgi:hypothetical protein
LGIWNAACWFFYLHVTFMVSFYNVIAIIINVHVVSIYNAQTLATFSKCQLKIT